MKKNKGNPNVEAEKLADEIVNAIFRPIIESGKVGTPLTVADLLWKGAYLAKFELTFDLDPDDTELLETVRSRDPERIKSLILKRYVDKKESIEDIPNEIQLVKQFLETPRRYRKLLKSLVDERVPRGPAGRYSKIQQEELPKLANLSEQLFPAVERFLAVREVMPKSTAEELLDFLSKEFPDQVEYIRSRVSLLRQLLSNDRLFIAAKGNKARARLLSDALAGDKWHMKPSYSIKLAKTARRLAKRSQKK